MRSQKSPRCYIVCVPLSALPTHRGLHLEVKEFAVEQGLESPRSSLEQKAATQTVVELRFSQYVVFLFSLELQRVLYFAASIHWYTSLSSTLLLTPVSYFCFRMVPPSAAQRKSRFLFLFNFV